MKLNTMKYSIVWTERKGEYSIYLVKFWGKLGVFPFFHSRLLKFPKLNAHLLGEC